MCLCEWAERPCPRSPETHVPRQRADEWIVRRVVHRPETKSSEFAQLGRGFLSSRWVAERLHDRESLGRRSLGVRVSTVTRICSGIGAGRPLIFLFHDERDACADLPKI